MKHIPLATLGDSIYFVDAKGRLCSLQEDEMVIECDEPMEPTAICSGIGGCGNYRIFIGDAKEKALKVFDPLNRRLDLLVKLPKVPLGLTKKECELIVSVEGGILKFDLKTLEIVGSVAI